MFQLNLQHQTIKSMRRIQFTSLIVNWKRLKFKLCLENSWNFSCSEQEALYYYIK